MYNSYALVVLGNGFDLHLGLRSKMKDFFADKVLTVNGDNSYSYNGKNLLYKLLYFRYFASGPYDYGPFRRVDNNDPTWMDVEGFIKKIATESKIFDALLIAYRNYLSDFPTLSRNNTEMIHSFTQIISLRKPSKSGAESVTHSLLMEDLLEFEESFKEYIKEQVDSNESYLKQADEFLEKIAGSIFSKSYYDLYLLNFNYTHGMKKPFLTANVHGSLGGKIIIGYDSTNDSTPKSIYELSKDWQKVEIQNESDLRSFSFDNVIFYGHSLGEQDYPYFFEIFDKCNLLDNRCNIELDFCFSKFGSVEEQKYFFNYYQINISKLLNAYEKYKTGNADRNTIITKLKSQNRLKLIEVID